MYVTHDRARIARVEGVFDVDRYAFLHGGMDRRRIEDLGPARSEFEGGMV